MNNDKNYIKFSIVYSLFWTIVLVGLIVYDSPNFSLPRFELLEPAYSDFDTPSGGGKDKDVILLDENNPSNPQTHSGDEHIQTHVQTGAEDISAKSTVGEQIGINSATQEQFMTLPGIGEIIADNIISYRNENGGFDSIGELLMVSRIGEKTLEKILPYIYLD